MNDILEKLQEIFRNVFNDDALTISENTTTDDIDNWDSMTHLLLKVEIEDTFHISFALGELQEIKSVSQMIKMINDKMKS